MPTPKQQISSLFYHHPDYFISGISQFYPFSETELDKYADVIDWEKINQNAAIPWTRKLIKKFDHRLDWFQFLQNAVFAYPDLLEACKDRIDWKGAVEDGIGFSVASSNYIIWTSDLIDR